MVDTKLGKREIGLQQIEYLYYIVCRLGENIGFVTLAYIPRPVLISTLLFTSLNKCHSREDLLMSMLLQRHSDKSSILKS